MHDDDRVQSSCVSEFHVVPGVVVNLEDAETFVKQSSLRHGCTVLYSFVPCSCQSAHDSIAAAATRHLQLTTFEENRAKTQHSCESSFDKRKDISIVFCHFVFLQNLQGVVD